MKKILFTLILIAGYAVSASAQNTLAARPDSTKPLLTLDAACGMCKFGLAANDCSLAVRYKGKAYFVDGTSIDDHGDAHDKHGFCMAVRKAEVQGTVVNNRFRVTYFKVLPPGTKRN